MYFHHNWKYWISEPINSLISGIEFRIGFPWLYWTRRFCYWPVDGANSISGYWMVYFGFVLAPPCSCFVLVFVLCDGALCRLVWHVSSYVPINVLNPNRLQSSATIHVDFDKPETQAQQVKVLLRFYWEIIWLWLWYATGVEHCLTSYFTSYRCLFLSQNSDRPVNSRTLKTMLNEKSDSRI